MEVKSSGIELEGGTSLGRENWRCCWLRLIFQFSQQRDRAGNFSGTSAVHGRTADRASTNFPLAVRLDSLNGMVGQGGCGSVRAATWKTRERRAMIGVEGWDMGPSELEDSQRTLH